MPTVAAAKLEQLVAVIMQGGGCAHEEAATVARRLVDSNLVGHDSHGVLRVPRYLDWIKDGTLKPNTPPTVVFDSDTIAIIDGNRGFGQVIGEFAAKARHRQGAQDGDRDDRPAQRRSPRSRRRLERPGAEAARCRCTFSTRRARSVVAPFGGTDRRLSTNPISIGVPIEGADPSCSTSRLRWSPKAS
jgi:uncharacterized oxidoreductase